MNQIICMHHDVKVALNKCDVHDHMHQILSSYRAAYQTQNAGHGHPVTAHPHGNARIMLSRRQGQLVRQIEGVSAREMRLIAQACNNGHAANALEPIRNGILNVYQLCNA